MDMYEYDVELQIWRVSLQNRLFHFGKYEIYLRFYKLLKYKENNKKIC